MTVQTHLGKMIRSFDGTELYCCENSVENEKAHVLIVHGLAEHAHRYDYVTEKLNAAGYSVTRYDHRGHGRSGGAFAHLDNFHNYLDDANFIVDTLLAKNKRLFMLGHSMGGFVTAAYGVKYPGKLVGQILSGPCITGLSIQETLSHINVERDALHMMPNALPHLICRSQQVVENYIHDPLVRKCFSAGLMYEVLVKGLDWLKASLKQYEYPCLILHGEDDKIVPVENSHYLHDNCSSKDKTIKTYPHLYHEILNEEKGKDAILAEIVAWMDQRIK